MRCKWVYEVDNKNECYRILTELCVQEHDDAPEQVWVANVFELDDAVEIVSAHNYMGENSSAHNSHYTK